MYDDIRTHVTTTVLAARDAEQPGLVVTFGDDPFSWDKPPEFFLQVEIEFTGAQQIGWSPQPRSREYGVVNWVIRSKCGRGDGEILRLLAWCRNTQEYLQASLATCWLDFDAFRPTGLATVAGWRLGGGTCSLRANPKP